MILSRLSRFLVVLLILGTMFGMGGFSCENKAKFHYRLRRPFINVIVRAEGEHSLSREQISDLLTRESLTNLRKSEFFINLGDEELSVKTTLDEGLQNYLLGELRTTFSPLIGIVVMNPDTGRILAMVSHNARQPCQNVCVSAQFPAASIAKIVTAVAGIEELGFDSESSVSYAGGKHTLYRYQLCDTKNRWMQEISLRDSFAQSVNPVFGKMGAHFLGRSSLEAYARIFGFNSPIRIETAIEKSTLALSYDPYHLAEIASGFTYGTMMSPVHGAMIAATASNGGILVEPTFVSSIVDQRGVELYHSMLQLRGRVCKQDSAEVLRQLMRETIDSGTCRKAFARYGEDIVLGRLDIGGKTGSIGNGDTGYKYDWFVGFADERNGDKKIAVAAVVAHEKFLSIRAAQYARKAIRHYFENCFAKHDDSCHAAPERMSDHSNS